jgi:hypothetical protein
LPAKGNLLSEPHIKVAHLPQRLTFEDRIRPTDELKDFETEGARSRLLCKRLGSKSGVNTCNLLKYEVGKEELPNSHPETWSARITINLFLKSQYRRSTSLASETVEQSRSQVQKQMSILSMFSGQKQRPLSEMKIGQTHQVSEKRVLPHNIGIKRSTVC